MKQNFCRLKVESSNKAAVQGTIRIYLLPIIDEKNEELLFEGCRKKAIELDRFLVKSKYLSIN